MTSVVLINPPSPVEALANREGTAGFGALSGGFTYPPHTLATVAAACREAGLDVAVIDAVAERFDGRYLPVVAERDDGGDLQLRRCADGCS